MTEIPTFLSEHTVNRQVYVCDFHHLLVLKNYLQSPSREIKTRFSEKSDLFLDGLWSFYLMKERLVFLHLLDHTTTNCTKKSWVEVFPFSWIHKDYIQKNKNLLKYIKKWILYWTEVLFVFLKDTYINGNRMSTLVVGLSQISARAHTQKLKIRRNVLVEQI